MEKNELIFKEYKLYMEQKDAFIQRNFVTNRFYFILYIVVIFALIKTSNVMFMNFLSATLLFSAIGLCVCALWYMNIDTYRTLIKIKYSRIIEKIEELLPVKPSQEESKAILEYRSKKIFMFSDIQKFVAAFGALFFFAILVSESLPLLMRLMYKMKDVLMLVKGGI